MLYTGLLQERKLFELIDRHTAIAAQEHGIKYISTIHLLKVGFCVHLNISNSSGWFQFKSEHLTPSVSVTGD